MKILMLNYEFPPLGGGAGNATFYLLKEFSQYEDLQIDLVTSSTGCYKGQQFSRNIKIYYLDIGKKGNLHYQSKKDLLIYSFKSYFFCKKLIKKNVYNLIHAFFGIPCGFIAMKFKIPYIVSLRGADVPFHSPRFYWLDKIFFKSLSRIICSNALGVIANSNGLKKEALESFPSQKIDVIHNGIDCTQFKPNYRKRGKLHILCVSRLTAGKGLEYLIKAFSKLKNSEAILTIIGEGNQEKRLKNISSSLNIAENIKFLHNVPHNSMVEIYQNNDVFVLPSLKEGMSNCVLEAMACGLPIIITDTGGTSELLNGNGFIIEKKDPCSIAKILRKFLEDRRLISRMGGKSREIAETMSWRDITGRYYSIYIHRGL